MIEEIRKLDKERKHSSLHDLYVGLKLNFNSKVVLILLQFLRLRERRTVDRNGDLNILASRITLIIESEKRKLEAFLFKKK